METTFTLESMLDNLEPLRELEHQLKLIHGLKIFFVEPEDTNAPVLISVGVHARSEQAELAIRRIAHELFDFLHASAEELSPRQLTLVTIEGQSFELEPLSSDEIKQIITEAYEGQ